MGNNHVSIALFTHMNVPITNQLREVIYRRQLNRRKVRINNVHMGRRTVVDLR